MKIIFVSHARTKASDHGLIMNSKDCEMNQVTSDGLYEFDETAKNIAKSITGKTKDQVYIYSATPMKSMQTTAQLSVALENNNLFSCENLVYDKRIDGRNYGQFEGIIENDPHKMGYLLKHPVQAFNLLKSEFVENNLGIEPKPEFVQRLGDFLCELYFTHNGKNDTVIVSASPDVFEAIQNDDELHSLLYFGYEKPEDMGEQSKDLEKIGFGESREFEIGAPKFDKITGQFIPYWETRARETQIKLLEKGEA